MLKKIIITIILALNIVPYTAHAMQQQQVQRPQQQKAKQKQKPAEHTHDGCGCAHHTPVENVPQEQTNTTENTTQDTSTETNEDVHIHEWGPEHPPCHLCGCTGISTFGICDWTVYGCLGRPHIFTCITCGITKLSIED